MAKVKLPKPVDKVDELDTVYRGLVEHHSPDGAYVSLATLQQAFTNRQATRRRGRGEKTSS